MVSGSLGDLFELMGAIALIPKCLNGEIRERSGLDLSKIIVSKRDLLTEAVRDGLDVPVRFAAGVSVTGDLLDHMPRVGDFC